MRMGKLKLVSITLGVLILGSVLMTDGMATGGPKPKKPKQTQITVTDLAGRQVKVTVPVERVVLTYGCGLHEFSAVAGEDVFKKIVGLGHDLKLYEFDTYRKYKERFPEIDSIPDVGSHHGGTLNVEKVISLRPDVVILPLFAAKMDSVADDIAKLQQAGIPVVFLHYTEKPFENSVPNILLLGTLLGKEKRTQRIVDFYKKEVEKVISRLQKIDKPKPKVYIECGWKGPSEYGGTSAGTGTWGAIVIKAGGNNIAEGIIKGSGQINPEYILKANPDIIIITGSHWVETPGSMRLGSYANLQESRQLLKAFTERPGWDTLSAVKNGRVYSIYFRFSGQIYNFVALQALAKWFYPDEFKDLDPEKGLKEFHRKFLPIEYSGVWMMGIKD